jgi:hypothetical protein
MKIFFIYFSSEKIIIKIYKLYQICIIIEQNIIIFLSAILKICLIIITFISIYYLLFSYLILNFIIIYCNIIIILILAKNHAASKIFL